MAVSVADANKALAALWRRGPWVEFETHTAANQGKLLAAVELLLLAIMAEDDPSAAAASVLTWEMIQDVFMLCCKRARFSLQQQRCTVLSHLTHIVRLHGSVEHYEALAGHVGDLCTVMRELPHAYSVLAARLCVDLLTIDSQTLTPVVHALDTVPTALAAIICLLDDACPHTRKAVCDVIHKCGTSASITSDDAADRSSWDPSPSAVFVLIGAGAIPALVRLLTSLKNDVYHIALAMAALRALSALVHHLAVPSSTTVAAVSFAAMRVLRLPLLCGIPTVQANIRLIVSCVNASLLDAVEDVCGPGPDLVAGCT